MAERKKAKYPRVYQKHGAWHWVEPRTGKWIRLCALTDSETMLVERLAAERKRFERPEGTGDMRPLIDSYVLKHKHLHKEKAWPSYGKYAGTGFRNANVADIEPGDVNNWLKIKYAGKLSMQRVMRAFLSGFFQWCVDERKRKTNPCKEVKLKKPKPSKVYITDDDFAAIRAAMLSYTYTTGAGKTITGRVNTGPMMQCFVDLCYLTAQRSTEIRLLKWSQIDRAAGVIHFVPTKTEDSSGIAVDFTINPEIEAVLDRVRSLDAQPRIGDAPVIHALDGTAYGATAVRSAWDRATERVSLADKGYTVKMIRAKALTDAERAGYDIKALQIAAAHSDTKTTEIYLKQRDVPVADVRLRIPGRAA
ncbi:tyrosine-type recombinase/integrase [Paraburkholderia sartisoli]|uniref:Site-specific recombinase XerD n=1 Tax=Paraburkholderia sartisoli TaxID=83784 RepID=A0A1H4HSN0_9BURK|nr:tyrosine-type recombinase/integrase [Paraburkholderia sartisoli]SEB24735.1 Site-specific recombinase XerD [Paraburkholderia sartisoli]